MQKCISLHKHRNLGARFAENYIIDRKFHASAQEMVVRQAEFELSCAFTRHDWRKGPLDIKLIEMKFQTPIGTDPIVALKDHQDKKVIPVNRYSEKYDITYSVNALETDHVPETNIATLVLGPYEETRQWGIYTIYAGKASPVFPHNAKLVTEDQRAKSKEFWDTHGFLATAEDIHRAFVKNYMRTNGNSYSAMPR